MYKANQLCVLELSTSARYIIHIYRKRQTFYFLYIGYFILQVYTFDALICISLLNKLNDMVTESELLKNFSRDTLCTIYFPNTLLKKISTFPTFLLVVYL